MKMLELNGEHAFETFDFVKHKSKTVKTLAVIFEEKRSTSEEQSSSLWLK
jgi:hypothetical protein